MSKVVIHRDGKEEAFKTEKIIKAIQTIIDPLKLDDPFVPMFKIIKNFELKLPERVSTSEIDDLLLKAIEGLISEDPLYDQIATAQVAKIINHRTTARFKTFKEFIHRAVEQKLIREDMLSFDLDRLEWEMDRSRDSEFKFFGIANFEKKYQLRDYDKKPLEKTQWTWMRIAMGVSFNEPIESRDEFCLKVYHQMSQFKYFHSCSTNAASVRSQMSSCYIPVIEDNLDHIMQKASEVAQLSKFEGGIGISFTKLRASGSLIKKINQLSSGPIPFMKIYDTIKSAMLQGTGKRRSAMVFYLEPRHYNIHEFLDLKETNGSDYVRVRSCNTALRVPDEFMKRVERDEDRYMFDPGECPELAESWGEEFEKHYAAYCMKAEAGELKLFKKESAKELYRKILIQVAKTGNFRLTFKDTHNRTSQAPSYGMIHSSNLCTEISIPNSGESTAVCTICSSNLTKILDQEIFKKDIQAMSFEKKLEYIKRDQFEETIKIAIQALDNIVSFNFYPSVEAEKNSLDLRPLGLGIMGFASLLMDLQIPYDHEDALKLSDILGAFIYKHALAKSVELGKSRGPFRDYDKDRYDYAPRRNILLMAIAPTASISLLAGVSSGIDSQFAMVYTRENQFGKFTVIVQKLINKLKEKGIRSEELKGKIIANGGSIQGIPEIAEHIDVNVYKTAYEFSAEAQIDIAATRQKHVDQSISRNLYFDESKRTTIGDSYMYAWKQGLKSTYYCFIQKTLQGEKYTQKVDKSAGRGGFGGKKGGFGAKKAGFESKSVADSSAPAGRGFGTKKVMATGSETDLSSIDLKNATDEDKERIEAKLVAEKGTEYVEKLKAGTLYEGACPVDPYEALVCESCSA